MLRAALGRTWVAGLALALAACASVAPRLPVAIASEVQVVADSDADFSKAHLEAAVKPEGAGGVSRGVAIRLLRDLAVYRLWNGPGVVDANGRTNRIGGWWTLDPPAGTAAGYRIAYEICLSWNELRWLARCTLKAGAVVAIGPGQSVSASTCGDANGHESYPANPQAWQVYVDKPWARPAEFECPPVEDDSAVDPDDLSRKPAR